MPYEFPTRGLVNTDVLDTVEMNGDVIRAAEKYSGRLNQHDFRASTIASAALAAGAYHTVRQNLFASVDPGWRHALGSTPDTAPADGFRLQNDGSWQVLDTMTSTFSTGTGILWIVGWLNYVSHTWYGSYGDWPASPLRDPCGADVQFAILLDGRIVGMARTGALNETLRTFIPATADVQRSGTNRPGPAAMRRDWAHSMGPPLCPVRFGAVIPVVTVSHTVEVVARRSTALLYRSVRYVSDFIVVLSRKLFTLEIPSMPPATSAAAAVDVSTFEPEDVFSAAAIGANRVNVIRNAYNDVQSGAVSRGGFNHFHLPTALLDRARSDIIPAALQTSNDIYPGYNTPTVAAAKTNGTGWWPLDDGAGADLSTLANHPTVFNTTTLSSYLLIFANVHVQTVRATGAGGGNHSRFGALALGYRRSDTGAQVIFGNTEAHFNSFNPDLQSLTTDRNIDLDVPMFQVIDATAPLVFNVDYIRVYGSSGDAIVAANPSTTEIGWLRGNIVVLQIRA